MSESQERMMAVVEPDDVDAFLAICAKWEVDATVIGEVTDGDRLQVDWHGERVVDVPPRSVAHDGPTYHRPFARPDSQDDLQADAAEPRSSTRRRDTVGCTLPIAPDSDQRTVSLPQPARTVTASRAGWLGGRIAIAAAMDSAAKTSAPSADSTTVTSFTRVRTFAAAASAGSMAPASSLSGITARASTDASFRSSATSATP